MEAEVLNKVVYFAVSYLLLFGVLASSTPEISEEKFSAQNCSNFKDKTIILNNCSHQWPNVHCEMVTMITSSETSMQVDLQQYLRFVLQFRILGTLGENAFHKSNSSDTEALGNCLSLEKLTIMKDNTFSNMTDYQQTAAFQVLLQLAGLEDINIEITIKSSGPDAELIFTNKSTTKVRMDDYVNLKLRDPNGLLKSMIKDKLEQFSHMQGILTRLHIVQSRSMDVRVWENIVYNKSYHLKIEGGRWTHLQKKQIPTMHLLKELDLSNNGIRVIEDGIFELTPNLETLSLSKNKLIELPSSLASLKNLQLLDLSSNPSLDTFTNNRIFQNLSNLLWLNLSDIPIKKLQHLKILNHQHNSSNLLGLQLRKCNLLLREDDVHLFDHLGRLMELDLSENQLTSIPQNLFRSLKHLRTLKLSSNRFAQIMNLNLKHSRNLDLLDLSRNKFVQLIELKIQGYIREIDMSENAILSWEDTNSYTNVKNVNQITTKSLNLSYNSITSISEDMKKVFSNFEAVDLGGNPVDCSGCNTPLLQRWLQENKTTTILNLGVVKSLTCGDLENSLKNVTDLRFSDEQCSVDADDPDYPLAVGVPLLVLAALILLSVIAVYGYRYEITYIRHLVNIRRQKHLKDGQSADRYKYDTFVSYSAVDRDWVMKELQPHLEQGAERYRLCLHERDFALGSIIADNIVECMKDSRNTLVILTPHFVKSQWCRWELEVANHKLFEDDREFLILIELKKLDKKTLPRHLGYLVDTRTYLEWPKGHGTHPRAWARLKSALGESLYQRRIKQKRNPKDEEPNTVQDQIIAESI